MSSRSPFSNLILRILKTRVITGSTQGVSHLIFNVLIFMVFVMKYCASWNIKIIELRILVRKTEIQTAKIILVRKIVAITVINRLRFQTKL